jgi:hypothetical protein
MDTFGLLGCLILLASPDGITLHHKAILVQRADNDVALPSARARYLRPEKQSTVFFFSLWLFGTSQVRWLDALPPTLACVGI